MSGKLSFIGVQITPRKDRNENLKNALQITDEALELHAKSDMVVLPEYFYQSLDPDTIDSIGSYPEEILEAFSVRARKHNTYMILGGVLNRKEDGRVYNTALLLGRNGEVAGSYDKTHLFDVLGAMGGNKESDFVAHGKSLFTYDADFGKLGICICYDNRFAEIARTYALGGAEYLFTPAAFYQPRHDHWQKLLSAAALQNQMYVTGVNLYGALDEKNNFCGRSMIADPWGVQVATASDGEGFIQAYVDPDAVGRNRDSIGTLYNRRPDIYNVK